MVSGNKLSLFLDWFFWVLLFLISFFSFGLAAKRPFNYVTIALWVCLGLLFLLRHDWKKRAYLDLFFWISLSFLAVQIVSFFASCFERVPTTPAILVLCNLILYEVILDNKIKASNCLTVACFGCIVFLALFAFVYRYEIIHPSFSQRIGTYFDNQNNVGRSMACSTILLAFSAGRVKNRFLKILFPISSAIAFYFLLLTGSVSALLSLTVTFLVCLPILFKKRRMLVLALELIVLVGGLVSLFTVPAFSYFAERVMHMLGSVGLAKSAGDGSFQDRFQGALVGFRIFLNYPLTGDGFDSVVSSFFITAHNNFSEILADFGLFGFLFAESLFIIPLCALRNGKWNDGRWIAPVLFFFFCFQLFLLCFNSKLDNLMLTLCFASAFPNGCYPDFLKKRSIKTDKISIQ